MFLILFVKIVIQVFKSLRDNIGI